MSQNLEKENVAIAALDYIQHDCVLGVGSGTTVESLIQNLDKVKHKIKSSVSSSEDTTKKLKQAGFIVDELSNVGSPDLYIDGADEVTRSFHMTKGGGGALTREKILASASKKIICIVASSKVVDVLGKYPLPVEVIPMAKSYISREIIRLGGQPELRQNFVTDNGNLILDIHNLTIIDPPQMEKKINNIAGVVTNGIFAIRPADLVLVGQSNGTITLENQ